VFHNGKKYATSIQYGSGYIKGWLVQDRMCLDAEAKACSKKFRMLDAYKGKSLLRLRSHGLVGLSPARDYRTPRFIDTLYDSGAIKKKVFSFFITKYYDAIN